MVLYAALMLHPNSSWSTSVFDTFTCLSLTLDGTLLPNVLLGRRRRGSRQRAGGRVRVWDQLYESRISSGRGVTAEHLATFHVCAPPCGRRKEGAREGGRTYGGWTEWPTPRQTVCPASVRLSSSPSARNEPLSEWAATGVSRMCRMQKSSCSEQKEAEAGGDGRGRRPGLSEAESRRRRRGRTGEGAWEGGKQGSTPHFVLKQFSFKRRRRRKGNGGGGRGRTMRESPYF